MATAVAKEAKRFGRYTLLGHIADGGMASVYLAQLRGDHRFSKWVALKVVHAKHAGDPRFEKMFLTEARIAARIDHPNVGQVFDSGVVDGTPYLAMEYLSGKTLQKLFSEARAHRIPFPLPIAARIIADAALGLHAAHELRDDNGASIGVVHRDVSPHNIFILYSGATKLMDFGIAASRDRYDEEKTAIDELKGQARLHVAGADVPTAARPALGHLLARHRALGDHLRNHSRRSARWSRATTRRCPRAAWPSGSASRCRSSSRFMRCCIGASTRERRRGR